MDQPQNQIQIENSSSSELQNLYQSVEANYINYKSKKNIPYNLSQPFEMVLKSIELSINNQYEESNKQIDQVLQTFPSDKCCQFIRDQNIKSLKCSNQNFQTQINDQAPLNPSYSEVQIVQNQGNQQINQILDNQQLYSSSVQQNTSGSQLISEVLSQIRQLDLSSEWSQQLQKICKNNMMIKDVIYYSKVNMKKQQNILIKLFNIIQINMNIICLDGMQYTTQNNRVKIA